MNERVINFLLDHIDTIKASAPLNKPSPGKVGSIHCTIDELRSLMSRALNTAEPHKTPQWAIQLHDALMDTSKDMPKSLTFTFV